MKPFEEPFPSPYTPEFDDADDDDDDDDDDVSMASLVTPAKSLTGKEVKIV